MKAAVAKQPISAAIAANSVYIHSYESGVIDATDCWTLWDDINPLNHGVLIVGYGTDEVTGLDYWLIKNSWNTTWGDKGYFKIAMNEDRNCGIDCFPSWPLVK